MLRNYEFYYDFVNINSSFEIKYILLMFFGKWPFKLRPKVGLVFQAYFWQERKELKFGILGIKKAAINAASPILFV
jgi:hypothetical protein